MRLVSFISRGRPSYGAVIGDGIIDLRLRFAVRFPSLLELLREDGLTYARTAVAGVRPDHRLTEVQLLPPVLAPEKILCIGINYANRNMDYNDADIPKYPSMFFRVPGSLVGHGQAIVRPKVSEQFDYEGEIAIVIGREGRYVAREHALDYIAGVTLCNEGSVRDWLRHGKFNVTQGKNFDASGSMGPWMVTSDSIDLARPLHLTVRTNNEVTQDDTTANMIFSFADIIAYVTTFMTLKPGDIIVTGTPVKLGPRLDPPRWLKPGDVVEISVPEIGSLWNKVVDEA
ncbi:MAG: fumarylacetoacetate hydrolase family protein [Bradyrhizobiaceae bacterium]|nr:fumarylacetoacetate hydrolase family protein [Bradyrhizobiaceae bacterium]